MSPHSNASLILSAIDYAAQSFLYVVPCGSFIPSTGRPHPDVVWRHFQLVRTVLVLWPMPFATVNEGMLEAGSLFVAHTEQMPPPRTEQVVRARWTSWRVDGSRSGFTFHPAPADSRPRCSLAGTLNQGYTHFFKPRMHDTGGINLSFPIRIDLLNTISLHCAADGPVRKRNILSTELPLGCRMQVSRSRLEVLRKPLDIIHAVIRIFALLAQIVTKRLTTPSVRMTDPH
ncbi:hypothetical protein B0H14DRAFT_2622281 [Mycena olivaceomarginata]|nr:hypothetical protein B0H14DRAFT_2622281 [Mycena olivaceomarginata]